MLAVSPLSSLKNEREGEMEGYSMQTNEFGDFSIDFDELFVGISDGDGLPYLEMDSEIFAEFSVSAGDESMPEILGPESNGSKRDDVKLAASSGSGSGSISSGLVQGDEIVSKRDEHVATKEGGDKARKSTASSKNLNGKRKVKVDWTPELHRRFVQAVEQLGVDKAVPSRILELMGVDCLTRHNVASHLQKYRSHRKHLLAREAEAASWSQRRQMYGTAAGGGGKKDHVNPWIAPTLVGFPPVTHMTQFRPLHVWGHPSVDQSRMHIWPKHLTHPPPQIHAWPPAQPHHHPPPSDHSFWISPHHVPTPGTPFFPPHLQPTMYPAPPVPGIPPPVMYKADMAGHGGMPPQPGQVLPRPPSDVHPSKESVDAAIGDVLSKPWLPLPLGLKPPSVDGVVVELQRQGISKIPPTCASNFEQAAVIGR